MGLGKKILATVDRFLNPPPSAAEIATINQMADVGVDIMTKAPALSPRLTCYDHGFTELHNNDARVVFGCMRTVGDDEPSNKMLTTAFRDVVAPRMEEAGRLVTRRIESQGRAVEIHIGPEQNAR